MAFFRDKNQWEDRSSFQERPSKDAVNALSVGFSRPHKFSATPLSWTRVFMPLSESTSTTCSPHHVRCFYKMQELIIKMWRCLSRMRIPEQEGTLGAVGDKPFRRRAF